MRPVVRFAALLIVASAVPLACTSASGSGWGYAPTSTGRSSTTTGSQPTTATVPASAPSSAMAGMPGTGAVPLAPVTIVPPAGGTPATQVARLDLVIVTGGMIGHTEFPAFVPSDFTLPANSTVIVTITNFDDATPLPKGSEQYASLTGTVDGMMSVTAIRLPYPNGSASATQTLSALDPKEVSHTFTIPALGVNVPIAAHTRTTFTIHTGAPGTYAWRCFDPCGADPMGWGTAMAAKRGFMEGTLTVA